MSTGRLTTHVLDTARGCAAAFMRVEYRHGAGKLTSATLDDGGRATLLSGEDFIAGAYEIHFHAGAYQKQFGAEMFFDIIPVKFHITDPAAHYHVPLVLSPFGYSTYRGG